MILGCKDTTNWLHLWLIVVKVALTKYQGIYNAKQNKSISKKT